MTSNQMWKRIKKEQDEQKRQEVIMNAMGEEIRRQVMESDAQYRLNLDAVVLWSLHTEFGFGKNRMMKLLKAIEINTQKMRECFVLDDVYPELSKLKDLGVDLQKITKTQLTDEYMIIGSR